MYMNNLPDRVQVAQLQDHSNFHQAMHLLSSESFVLVSICITYFNLSLNSINVSIIQDKMRYVLTLDI